MDQQNVDMFILNKGSYFPDFAIFGIREKLIDCDDNCLYEILSTKFKSPTIGFLFSIGLGVYGIDRFYVGHYLYGTLKLLLFIAFLGSCIIVQLWENVMPLYIFACLISAIGTAIWYISDIFKISKEIKEYNYHHLLTILN